MKKTRFIALLACVVMIASVFAGCAAPAESASPSPSEAPASEAPASEAPASEAPTSEAPTSEEPTEEPTEDPSSMGELPAMDGAEVTRIKEAGKLIMLTNAAFPPFEYLGDDNEVAGVDVDIAQAIADFLEVELEVVHMDFDGIIAALNSGKGDIGAAGMTVTEERLEAVDFSIDYVTSSQYIIVPEGNTEIATVEDLAGKTIGVQRGTTGDLFSSGEYGVEVNAGSVERFDNVIDAGAALASGKIDCVVADELPAKSVVAANEDALDLVDNKLTDEQFAIAMVKESDLVPVVNYVINMLMSEGEIGEFMLAHSES